MSKQRDSLVYGLSRSDSISSQNREQIMQIENLDSLARLSACIIHEMNNPLSGVLIYTRLLHKKIDRGEISKEKILDYLNKMDAELTRVTGLVKSLSEFAQQSNLVVEDLDLIDLTNGILEGFGATFESNKIQLLRELDPSLPRIRADRVRIQQVLLNLVNNAIQAMPEGGNLIVRAHLKSHYLSIDIQDSGQGISKDNLSKLFIPFFSTKPQVKGVGLGLAAAYGIVQKHGGSIGVQSQTGKGSIFSLNLPIFA
jgi:two-component system NtrC family sensor kinase